jgi:hypothetical protein
MKELNQKIVQPDARCSKESMKSTSNQMFSNKFIKRQSGTIPTLSLNIILDKTNYLLYFTIKLMGQNVHLTIKKNLMESRNGMPHREFSQIFNNGLKFLEIV